jgi:hypothetical protein
MDTAIIFDCEFLVIEGAPQNFWCGPFDPDPVIAQIGAAKLSLQGDFAILGSTRLFVKPVDRHGRAYALDPFFTRLTGISDETIADKGIALQDAINALDRFSGGAQLWSWGKDELNMMAISCYVANVAPKIPAHRFDNACKLLLRAGMPYADMKTTRSNKLSGYYGLRHPPLQEHDALDDALSVTYVPQHLLKAGKLTAAHFGMTD